MRYPGQALEAWRSSPRLRVAWQAELRAVIEVNERTQGDIAIWSDCAYVVKHGSRRLGARATTNPDLWARLWQAAERRRGQVTFVTVKAHTTDEDERRGAVSTEQRELNRRADRLANHGADRAAVPSAAVDECRKLMGEAIRVQARLLAVAEERIARWPLPGRDKAPAKPSSKTTLHEK